MRGIWDLSSASQTLEKAPWPRGRRRCSVVVVVVGSPEIRCEDDELLLLPRLAVVVVNDDVSVVENVVESGGGVTVRVGEIGLGWAIHGGLEVMIHPGTGSI